MGNQTRNRRRRHKGAEPPKPIGPHPGLLPREAAIHWLRTPVPPPARQSALPDEAGPTLVDLEDVLVADPRGRLTPAQHVELKLLALLAAGSPGSFIRAGGKATNIRRYNAPGLPSLS